jgi:hypothetical protein
MTRVFSLLLILGLAGCSFDSEPIVTPEAQAALDFPSTQVPVTYTPTDGEETVYTGAVTLFPGGSVAFPITAGVQSVMPWYSGNSNVREGDVYFNIGNNIHAYFEFNLPRAPLWVPVPDGCGRIFMRNDSAETINVGVVFSGEQQ